MHSTNYYSYEYIILKTKKKIIPHYLIYFYIKIDIKFTNLMSI